MTFIILDIKKGSVVYKDDDWKIIPPNEDKSVSDRVKEAMKEAADRLSSAAE